MLLASFAFPVILSFWLSCASCLASLSLASSFEYQCLCRSCTSCFCCLSRTLASFASILLSFLVFLVLHGILAFLVLHGFLASILLSFLTFLYFLLPWLFLYFMVSWLFLYFMVSWLFYFLLSDPYLQSLSFSALILAPLAFHYVQILRLLLLNSATLKQTLEVLLLSALCFFQSPSTL